MTDKEIQAIRERCEAASPAPWRNELVVQVVADLEIPALMIAELGDVHDKEFIAASRADAAFLANARTDIPSLLDALEEARRDSARLDWLDGNGFKVRAEWHYSEASDTYELHWLGTYDDRGPSFDVSSIREAIDAARSVGGVSVEDAG